MPRIDTLKAFRRLRDEAAFSEKEAEAIVDLFRDVEATRSDTLAAFRHLREKGGFSEKQADAIVGVFTDAFGGGAPR
jgi:RNAse (barnase) inhibitor barstar